MGQKRNNRKNKNDSRPKTAGEKAEIFARRSKKPQKISNRYDGDSTPTLVEMSKGAINDEPLEQGTLNKFISKEVGDEKFNSVSWRIDRNSTDITRLNSLIDEVSKKLDEKPNTMLFYWVLGGFFLLISGAFGYTFYAHSRMDESGIRIHNLDKRVVVLEQPEINVPLQIPAPRGP